MRCTTKLPGRRLKQARSLQIFQVLRTVIILFAIQLFVMSAAAQPTTVTGTITDEAGETIIGANIMIKGTTIGTISDVNGSFTLDVDDPSVIRGKKVLVVEDGPTLTHGEMKIGAGVVAARKFGAAELVDPRPYTVGRLTETFEIYPEIGTLLPAMGYGEVQLKDMETSINNTECDAVVIATPIDLNRIIKIDKPNTRVYYNLQEIGRPNFDQVLADFVARHQI